MSKVHDAMRQLEQKTNTETASGGALSSLVGALIEELANEVPDDPRLESVRADLMAASRSFDGYKKKDLALRFYLAMRALLRENELLQERLRKIDRRLPPPPVAGIENVHPATEAGPHIATPPPLTHNE